MSLPTFCRGQNRIIAEAWARLYRDRFAMMQLKDGRDVWTRDDEAWVKTFIDAFKLSPGSRSVVEGERWECAER